MDEISLVNVIGQLTLENIKLRTRLNELMQQIDRLEVNKMEGRVVDAERPA